jgi:hypothetical protein
VQLGDMQSALTNRKRHVGQVLTAQWCFKREITMFRLGKSERCQALRSVIPPSRTLLCRVRIKRRTKAAATPLNDVVASRIAADRAASSANRAATTEDWFPLLSTSGSFPGRDWHLD